MSAIRARPVCGVLRQDLSGGYSCGVPPLPIPNREVKPARADGTAMQCGRVGRRLLCGRVGRRLLYLGALVPITEQGHFFFVSYPCGNVLFSGYLMISFYLVFVELFLITIFASVLS